MESVLSIQSFGKVIAEFGCFKTANIKHGKSEDIPIYWRILGT